MERRDFLKWATATAAGFAASGFLPLLGAEARKDGRMRQGGRNIFTEPCAIEPITGYLPGYSPVENGSMAGDFTAQYALIVCSGSAEKANNHESGSLKVSMAGTKCETTEKRESRPDSTLKTSIQCSGELNTASQWVLNASIGGQNALGFVEEGSWDGKTMTVRSKSWTQRHPTTHPLIARWSLLPLLASGRIKKTPLTFDMLDDSTLRPNQTLRYMGGIQVPVKGGEVELDCYAQTGQGIVPTHYLVDAGGRVQLVTMSFVNWALNN